MGGRAVASHGHWRSGLQGSLRFEDFRAEDQNYLQKSSSQPEKNSCLRRPGRPPLKGAWAKRALEETQPRDSECTKIARPEPRDEIRTAREVPRSRMVVVLLL
jgi:hypothetical protein